MRIFWYSGDERSRQALAAELSRQGHLVRCAETPELPLEGEDLVLLQLPPDLDESVVLLREFRKRASAATISGGSASVPSLPMPLSIFK